MKTILITGFEPFGGDNVNPALEAVKRLEDYQLDGAKIVTCSVPVALQRSIVSLGFVHHYSICLCARSSWPKQGQIVFWRRIVVAIETMSSLRCHEVSLVAKMPRGRGGVFDIRACVSRVSIQNRTIVYMKFTVYVYIYIYIYIS